MPVNKCPKKSEPLWKDWDRKALKNGMRHQVFAVNGDHYVGEWKDNLKHGQKSMRSVPAFIFIFIFLVATVFSDDPSVSPGKGTQVWKKSGAIYEGDWKFGKRDGYGTFSRPDPETGKYRREYSGWWKGDKKSGYGIQFFGPKDYYEGEWCGNQRCGWGRMYYSNGQIYEGQWRNDKPEGEGMLRLMPNDLLAHPCEQLGLLRPSKIVLPASLAQHPCFPVLSQENGNRYEGSWERGMKNGHGRFFHLDHGQLFEGFWVDDVAKCGTMIDFGRDEAPEPTQFPIPKVEIEDPDGVLREAIAALMNSKKEED
ncbi:MORN repeat-containing protein 3 [Cricetulus griseus]|uniref:MORN repeat-containing protein 3 n=1 Tax=Cricetulus griseus TaxID=10029 RepID=G3H249_CRIGR|nr:MORN repeat-containing protein 3 [Cricetulus griseus]